jgi:hypothetical protein
MLHKLIGPAGALLLAGARSVSDSVSDFFGRAPCPENGSSPKLFDRQGFCARQMSPAQPRRDCHLLPGRARLAPPPLVPFEHAPGEGAASSHRASKAPWREENSSDPRSSFRTRLNSPPWRRPSSVRLDEPTMAWRCPAQEEVSLPVEAMLLRKTHGQSALRLLPGPQHTSCGRGRRCGRRTPGPRRCPRCPSRTRRQRHRP